MDNWINLEFKIQYSSIVTSDTRNVSCNGAIGTD